MGHKCELCQVYLPNDTSAQQHYNGAKHKKLLEAKQIKEELASRSVFITGYPDGSLTDFEISHHFATHYGPVERVMSDSIRRTFATVIFQQPDAAKKALSDKKHKIGSQHVVAKPTESSPVKSGQRLGETPSPPVLNDSGERECLLPVSVENLPVIFAEHILLGIKSPEMVDQMKFIKEVTMLDDMERRVDIVSQYQHAVNLGFASGFRLELFGSSVNGLGMKGCDLDLKLIPPQFDATGCFQLTRSKPYLLSTHIGEVVKDDQSKISADEWALLEPFEKAKILRKVLFWARRVIEARNKADETHLAAEYAQVTGSRCALVKFIHRGYRCQISVNDQMGLVNSQWLKVLAQNGTLANLLFSLRYWAKAVGICKSVDVDEKNLHCLTSYAFTLMVITYLQSIGVIPSVAGMQSEQASSEQIEGWNGAVWQQLGAEVDESLSASNPANFLVGFIKFYAEVDLSQSVLSPLKGQLIPLATFQSAVESCGDPRLKTFRVGPVNIQDPFVLSHNTAKNVNDKAAAFLNKMFKKAAKTCSSDAFWSPGATGTAGIFSLLQTAAVTSPVKDGSAQHKASEQPNSFELPLGLRVGEVDEGVLLSKLQSVVRDILYLDVDSATRKHPISEELVGGEEPNGMDVDDTEPTGTQVLWHTKAKPVYRIWVGRRHLRRELKRDRPDWDDYQLELEVSRQIADAQVKSGDEPSGIAFTVEMKKICGAYVLQFSDVSNPVGFKDFHSFLTGFIPKLMRSIVQ